MDLAVVLDVVARTGFEVRQVFRVRDLQPVMLADPVAHACGRRNQIDPDRLDAGEQRRAIDGYLAQPAIVQFEGVDHDLAAGVLAVADEFLGNVLGQQVENAVQAILGDLLPGHRALLFRQGAEDDRHGHGGQGGEKCLQAKPVLALKNFQQFLARTLLVPGFFLVDTNPCDQVVDLREIVLDFVGIRVNFGQIFVGVGLLALLVHGANAPCCGSGNWSSALTLAVGNGSRRRFR